MAGGGDRAACGRATGAEVGQLAVISQRRCSRRTYRPLLCCAALCIYLLRMQVALLFKRLTDPEFVKREEERKKKEEAAAAEAAKAAKKPGAWGGLPSRR